jgi:hypothetical protein
MSSKRDVGPDGHSSKRDIEPDGLAKHSAIEEDDVEGHSMLISPTLGRDLDRARSADVERSVKNKNNEVEAKRIFRK